MKVFFVGDFNSNTGPAIANKMIKEGLKNEKMLYSESKTKFTRVIELVMKMLVADCVCFCSYSQLNFLGIKVTKFFKKKSYYIMHGYRTYEYQINDEFINNNKLKKINESEMHLFKNVEKIFCVSKRFMEFMKDVEPEFANKFDYNYNGLDLEKIEQTTRPKSEKNPRQIVSIGGGKKQKNILTICKAIEKINKENEIGLSLIVIGLPYTYKDQICNYDFVTYYDSLSHERVLEILAGSYLYIQNSTLETFGLAVIEALMSGCNLLISNNIGASGILSTIESKDLIFNTVDIDEISQKVKNLLIDGNAQRLQKGLDRKQVNLSEAANLLVRKIMKCMGEQ